MNTLACGHVAHPGASRMCRHLAGPADIEDVEYVRLLTGNGLDHDMCCVACDKAAPEGKPPALVEACEGCAARVADEGGYVVGWRGRPGIPERPEALDPTVFETPLPAGLGAVADIVPLAGHGRSRWLMLTEAGQIARVDAGTGEFTIAAITGVPAEPDHQPWAGHLLRRRLHGSPDGRFAAVVNDYGHHGQVIDLGTGEVTLVLRGGDHRPDTVPFSVAFARHRGRTVVAHRTDWNRLDISDPATGELLTPRGPTAYQRNEPRPEHYRDYFHGALLPSPTGRWLADDGWVWHPIGIPTVCDLHRWLDTNPWESEDGPTLRQLCHRDYHWNVPMCWIGDDLLAVSGIGDDDLAMLPGARIFDVATGAEPHTFAGPQGAFFAAGQRLCSAAPDGLEVWDPFTGHRTGRVPGFVPTHHNPSTGELVAVRDKHLLRVRLDGARS